MGSEERRGEKGGPSQKPGCPQRDKPLAWTSIHKKNIAGSLEKGNGLYADHSGTKTMLPTRSLEDPFNNNSRDYVK